MYTCQTSGMCVWSNTTSRLQDLIQQNVGICGRTCSSYNFYSGVEKSWNIASELEGLLPTSGAASPFHHAAIRTHTNSSNGSAKTYSSNLTSCGFKTPYDVCTVEGGGILKSQCWRWKAHPPTFKGKTSLFFATSYSSPGGTLSRSQTKPEVGSLQWALDWSRGLLPVECEWRWRRGIIIRRVNRLKRQLNVEEQRLTESPRCRRVWLSRWVLPAIQRRKHISAACIQDLVYFFSVMNKGEDGDWPVNW